MIDRADVLPLTRPVPPARLAIMHRIDALHLEHPFAGSRTLREVLRAERITIGRLSVATLMGRMGIEALKRETEPPLPASDQGRRARSGRQPGPAGAKAL